MKNSRRTFLTRAAVAVLAASSLLLAGCSNATSGQSASTSDKAVVTVNNVEPAAGLIPSNTDDLAGWKVVTQLYEGLVTFDASGKLVYADATSITPNADASKYTIKLRSGLVFSDGEKITASTYAKSWSFAANAANGQLGAAIFSTIKGYDALQDEHGDKNAQLSGLKVINDTTLEVTLAAPDSSFPYKVGDVAFLPLPNSAYKDIDAFGEHPVGNGPYKLASWSHDKEINLVPNPTYTGPRTAKNGGVTYELYTSLDAAYSDLLAGNLDVLDSIPSSALKTYKQEQLQTVSKAGPGFKSFTIPQSMAHFSGKEGKLRRAAIAHAVDREAIIKKVLYGTATRATDFTAPTIAGYSKILAGASVLDYDASQAKKLWKQADDINQWKGTFRLAYSTDSGNKPWIDAICNSITNALGIDAQPLIFSTSKELSTAIHNRTVGAAFIQGLQSDYPHPEGYLVQAYDSASADGKGLNNGDYKSAAFDALIDQAARQTTLDGAIGYYHKAEELLFEDLPVIPLWYTNVTAAAGKQVGSLSFNYMGLPDYYRLTVKS
ncbi:ABC transporter substrate-binding protein [Bifidobacterium apri]|uniref:peptide ABC transporter substrate-binding protein n=1 Tax=Bifidobacterium apri TaxID=1769423 RepID=UPI003995162E